MHPGEFVDEGMSPDEFFEHPGCEGGCPDFGGLEQMTDDPFEFTAICPNHGREDITGSHSTGGPDPWNVDELACGCDILDMGVGLVTVLKNTGKRRTRNWQGNAEDGPSTRDWMHP